MILVPASGGAGRVSPFVSGPQFRSRKVAAGCGLWRRRSRAAWVSQNRRSTLTNTVRILAAPRAQTSVSTSPVPTAQQTHNCASMIRSRLVLGYPFNGKADRARTGRSIPAGVGHPKDGRTRTARRSGTSDSLPHSGVRIPVSGGPLEVNSSAVVAATSLHGPFLRHGSDARRRK
ncbi:hypothetical protein PHLGIDRAFT_324536 [Phlebiopsis gigantea 11061_1 CR5-6]|uniref:Uncharacterized protein n=1 Tax=Phlebiopsis gigantea (strain 11061_1 CR5-6) TaxID=745531 RepID=A0A0C3PQP5_PHLG1|nr:hypothetical protein PHLGIDRAFT_324536 [Phlebiopsis gigantea 11061_1 CR5-6]